MKYFKKYPFPFTAKDTSYEEKNQPAYRLDTNLLSTLYHYILYHIYKLMTFKVDITKIFTGQFENVQDNLGFYRTIWNCTGQFFWHRIIIHIGATPPPLWRRFFSSRLRSVGQFFSSRLRSVGQFFSPRLRSVGQFLKKIVLLDINKCKITQVF